MGLWKTVKGYIWWEYERGSLHYDVMVTLILAFIFLAPLWVNFKDKPIERGTHQTRVVVLPEEQGLLVYQIDAAEVRGQGDAAVRRDARRVIQEISNSEVEVVKWEPQCRPGPGPCDSSQPSRVTAYKVWARP
ncbi:MAG TPA: hypothetical protein VL382_09810 [Terriglobales bacterium]|nr:hypothetical protein [Terriglobales bacterium]